jgi:hypothetical protein
LNHLQAGDDGGDEIHSLQRGRRNRGLKAAPVSRGAEAANESYLDIEEKSIPGSREGKCKEMRKRVDNIRQSVSTGNENDGRRTGCKTLA